MAAGGNYTKHSALDDISDAEIDLMIQSLGPMDPMDIAEVCGVTNTRIHQIVEKATVKAIRVLERRGFTASNIDDLFGDGTLDTSYWRVR